ncbi:MAG: hypothetical protein EPN61_18285 [Burkholderiaceae bacterium]|nr:MAG: hypothetical protein EPN61_18285 [Burkholderiaceae bacterium]
MNETKQFREACEAQIMAWTEVRDQQPGILVEKRNIVLDARGRAYGSLPDGRYKLEYPRSNLAGVSHFNFMDARELCRRMDIALPEFAPSKVMDFKTYAESRVDEAQKALSMIKAYLGETKTSETPLPSIPNTWVITAASGEFVVNAESGDVVSYTVYENGDDPDFRERAENIARFDVAEYRQWFESVGLTEPTNLNWLGIGFWQKDGFYESFEQDWRDDLVTAMNDNRAAAVETAEP